MSEAINYKNSNQHIGMNPNLSYLDKSRQETVVKVLYIRSNWEMLALDSNIQSNLEMHASSQCMLSSLGMCVEDFDIHRSQEIDEENSNIQSK